MADDEYGRERYERIARAARSVRPGPDDVSVRAVWTDQRGWDAGIEEDAEGPSVFYGSAWSMVESAEEAALLLKAIFADEIVCVSLLDDDDQPVMDTLARHDDPTTPLMQPGASPVLGGRNIGHVLVRSWSGKRDRE